LSITPEDLVPTKLIVEPSFPEKHNDIFLACLFLFPQLYGFPLITWQMAIAAVAHIYVFSAEPYRFIPVSGYGRVSTETTKAEMKFGGGDQEKSAVFEKRETQVAAPGTSVSESVQDIVLEGGQSVSFSPRKPSSILKFLNCWILFLRSS
jgi:hypothetical protein